MFDYSDLYSALKQSRMKSWIDILPKQVEKAFLNPRHGDMPDWIKTLEVLPETNGSSIDLDISAVRAGEGGDCDDVIMSDIEEGLRKLHPWRKGPYDIHGLRIDTEWRSDWKWERISEHIQSLENKLVLDVGCGNGYHCWRMKGAGARLVVGADPYMIYVMQFLAIKHFLGEQAVHVIPLGIEDLPKDNSLSFDTVFSMGVLYHRRSPLDHLMELLSYLREGGELVLETLVIEGEAGKVLVPDGRYAKMRNVWFIPSCLTMELWLKRIGFKNIRMVDLNQTSIDEQRVTDWMGFESLADFLDPKNLDLTVEGYPAPKRAVFIASK